MTLRSTINTPAVEYDIRSSARAQLGARRLQANYEHGQWWLTDLRSGAQWSVCDAEGEGYAFEQVTAGDE